MRKSGRNGKPKRVTWAPDHKLCQILDLNGEKSDAVPPGYGGSYLAKQSRDRIHVPCIRWTCPPKFAVSSNWFVATAEESEEAGSEEGREFKVLEAFYPRSIYIPSNPFVSSNIEREDYDDTLTPIIPIIGEEIDTVSETTSLEGLVDKSSGDGTVSAIEIDTVSETLSSEGLVDKSSGFGTESAVEIDTASETPSLEILVDESPSLELLVDETPSLELLVHESSGLGTISAENAESAAGSGFWTISVEDARLAAAASSIFFNVLIKITEQGHRIDTNQLVKFLYDPEMIGKISKNETPSAGSKQASPQISQSSTPLSLPESEQTTLSLHMSSLELPLTTSTAPLFRPEVFLSEWKQICPPSLLLNSESLLTKSRLFHPPIHLSSPKRFVPLSMQKSSPAPPPSPKILHPNSKKIQPPTPPVGPKIVLPESQHIRPPIHQSNTEASQSATEQILPSIPVSIPKHLPTDSKQESRIPVSSPEFSLPQPKQRSPPNPVSSYEPLPFEPKQITPPIRPSLIFPLPTPANTMFSAQNQMQPPFGAPQARPVIFPLPGLDGVKAQSSSLPIRFADPPLAISCTVPDRPTFTYKVSAVPNPIQVPIMAAERARPPSVPPLAPIPTSSTMPDRPTFTPTVVPDRSTFTPTVVPDRSTFTPTVVPDRPTFTPAVSIIPGPTVLDRPTFTPMVVPDRPAFTPAVVPDRPTFTPAVSVIPGPTPAMWASTAQPGSSLPSQPMPAFNTMPARPTFTYKASALLNPTLVTTMEAARAPPVKDANFYKNLVREHGDYSALIAPNGVNQNQLQNLKMDQKLVPNGVTTLKNDKKICMFFNTEKGCWKGFKCSYLHEMPSQQGSDDPAGEQRAKRMKFGG